jgi:VanZ family protein
MTSLLLHRRLWQTLFVLFFIVISYLALSPAPPDGISTGWDKANHALAFAALAFSSRFAGARRAWLVFIALLTYGGAIELLQMQIPNRDGDWHDLLADGVGIALGLLASLRASADRA